MQNTQIFFNIYNAIIYHTHPHTHTHTTNLVFHRDIKKWYNKSKFCGNIAFWNMTNEINKYQLEQTLGTGNVYVNIIKLSIDFHFIYKIVVFHLFTISSLSNKFISSW